MDQGESIGMMAGAYFVGRHELLRWINDLTQLNYTKIEQTASGVFVCHVFDALFPGEIKLEKVNFNARQQYEFIQNYKVLQAAFKRLKLKKEIDVERLVKAKYQDNLEFIQWVKAFYDSHAGENALDYDAPARREAVGAKLRTGPRPGPRPALGPNRTVPNERPARPASAAPSAASRLARTRPARPARPQPPTEPMVKKTEFDALMADNDRLAAEIERLQQAVDDGDTEREFYFNKLRNVEVIVQDLEEEIIPARADPNGSVEDSLVKAVEQIKQILYAEDDVPPEEEEAEPAGEDEASYDPDGLPEEAEHAQLTAEHDFEEEGKTGLRADF